MADVSTLISVTTRIETESVPRLDFGRGLLVTEDDALPAGGPGKARLFNSLAAVTDFFPAASTEVLNAARTWFAADPAARGLYIGRWARVDVATSLVGSAAVRDFTAGVLATDTGTVSLNGVATAAIDLTGSGADTGAGVATALQNALNALTGVAGVTVTFGNDRFTVTLGDASLIDGGGLGDSALAQALGLDAGTATYLIGSDMETLPAGVAEMFSLAPGGAPVAVMLSRDITSTNAVALSLAAAAETAGTYIVALREEASAVLTPNETGSLSAMAYAAEYGNTAMVYNDPAQAPGAYPDVALMAFLSGQDYSQPNSLATPHPKRLLGVAASDVSNLQLAELRRKRVNVYTNLGALARLFGGFTSQDGYWLDTRYWLIWLGARLEGEIFTVMSAPSTRRLTNELLSDAMGRVMAEASRSGGLETGGEVSTSTKADIIARTGNRSFSGILPRGYLVVIERATAADRQARTASGRVYLVGSRAIHEVAIEAIFTN